MPKGTSQTQTKHSTSLSYRKGYVHQKRGRPCAAMPYEKIAGFVAELRNREAVRRRLWSCASSPPPAPCSAGNGEHQEQRYEEVAGFVAKLRKREASSALALELCILTAACVYRKLKLVRSDGEAC